MLSRNSQLNFTNKLLLCKAMLKPIWTYEIYLWDAPSQSNIEIIQRFETNMLGIITNASWSVINDTLHHDLNIPIAKEEIEYKVKIYRARIQAKYFMSRRNLVRKLKRKTPLDWLSNWCNVLWIIECVIGHFSFFFFYWQTYCLSKDRL